MIRAKRILIPNDFSIPAEQAVNLSFSLAKILKPEEIHLVYADVLHHDPPATGVTKSAREELIETKLSQYFNGERKNYKIVNEVVRDVSVNAALLNYIREKNIDFVVIGTHGRHGVKRWILGSVAESIVHQSPVPVLTVCPNKNAENHFQNILVPIDFSKHAKNALIEAKHFANQLGASLVLLHVLSDSFHPAFYSPALKSIYDIDPDIDEKAQIKLVEFFHTSAGPIVPFKTEVCYGHPAEEIINYVNREPVDMVFLSTHGMSDVENFFIGSITERVVRMVKKPVFVSKSFGKSLLTVEDEAIPKASN